MWTSRKLFDSQTLKPAWDLAAPLPADARFPAPDLSALRFTGFLALIANSTGATGDIHLLPNLSPIERLRHRDPEAWNQFFLEQMPAVYQYVASRTAHGAEAEDLTSEVFEAAWASADRLQDRGLPARAWLIGIARNVVSDHRRRWWRRPPAVAVPLELIPEGGSSGETHALADAIARLAPAHAEVINMRFIQGFSLGETAHILSVSIDAIKGRQARALLALREALA